MSLTLERPRIGQLSKDQLDSLLFKLKCGRNDEGKDCVYVRLDEKTGVKCYFEKHTRNYAFRYQTLFSKMGLAPEVYSGKFECSDYYCFVTEHVQVLENLECSEEIEEYLDELEDLQDKMLEHGFAIEDCQVFNLGVKNGQLMYIDFGRP